MTEQCSGCGNITLSADSKLARIVTMNYPPSGEDDPMRQDVGRRSSVIGRNARDFGNEEERLEAGQDVSSKASENLLEACRQGSYRRAVEALDAGAALEVRTLRKQSVLMLAAASCSKTSVETLKFLLETQADMEARDDQGWTPLMHACRNNQQEAAAILIAKGASVKVRAIDGKTAIMLAAMDGADGLIADLVVAQAALDKKDDRGWPVLFFACEDGRHELVKWLLKKQANAKEKAKDGYTAMMVAAGSGHVKIGERLQRKGALINAQSLTGSTALVISLKSQSEEFADWLLDMGAEVPPKAEGEDDALDIAEALGMNALRSRLEMKLRQSTEG